MRHTPTHIFAAVLLLVLVPRVAVSENATAIPPDAVSVPVDATPAEPGAVLYYFHRTFRCHSCLTMEAYIDEALRTHFAEALEEGRLLWLPTNIEESENAHFENDFSIEFNSAVLARLDGEAVTSWTNLEKVWDLVDSKSEFLDYIVQEVDPVLAGGGKGPDGPEPN